MKSLPGLNPWYLVSNRLMNYGCHLPISAARTSIWHHHSREGFQGKTQRSLRVVQPPLSQVQQGPDAPLLSALG